MSNHIQKISEYCKKNGDRYGGKLIELMERHDAINLQQITEEQAKEFYEELLKQTEGTEKESDQSKHE